jgi:hypothetical protein
LVTAVAGFFGFAENLTVVDSAMQKWFLVPQGLYSVAGLIAAGGLLARRRWTIWPLCVWAMGATATAAFAPVAWGGAGFGSALSAGLATALVTALVVWGGRRVIRA